MLWAAYTDLAKPLRRRSNATIISGVTADDTLADLVREQWAIRRRRARAALAPALEGAGLDPTDEELDLVLDMATGAAYTAILVRLQELPEHAADRVADILTNHLLSTARRCRPPFPF